ncbi:hypothetical protein AcV7_003370 [Taiwanofungus camphoratus]|nr:hypothetical protein AcV7_003370 [Antrodia cinnamomea]
MTVLDVGGHDGRWTGRRTRTQASAAKRICHEREGENCCSCALGSGKGTRPGCMLMANGERRKVKDVGAISRAAAGWWDGHEATSTQVERRAETGLGEADGADGG